MWIDIGVTLLLALRLHLIRPTTPLLPESSDEDDSAVRGDDEKDRTTAADRTADNPAKSAAVLHATNRD
jgi:hypothetical protein